MCNETSGKKSGQINSRSPRLTYSEDPDKELADWVYGCLDLGYIITREVIKEKALEIIKPTTPQFKAFDPWLQAFINRHYFSFRKLNDKPKYLLERLENLLLR